MDSKHSNGNSNISKRIRSIRILIRMVPNWIRMLQISLKWFEFSFECFESQSNGSNFHSNEWNLVWSVRLWIRMLRIPFEWFDSLSNGSILDWKKGRRKAFKVFSESLYISEVICKPIMEDANLPHVMCTVFGFARSLALHSSRSVLILTHYTR